MKHPSRETTVQRQARIRRAILNLLRRQQMTQDELIAELDYLATPARIKRQISHLVGRSHLTRIDRPDGTAVFEHWDLTMERVRHVKGANTVKPRVRREPRRVA